MTREEAITYLNVIWNRYRDEYEIERETLDAYHMAIEALSDRPTDERTTLDEVVRCKDCQWRADIIDVDTGEMYHTCGVLGFDIPDGFACNQGKRKGVDDDLQ